jgi:hypothetical protein
MDRRSLRVGFASIAFVAALSVRYEGHAVPVKIQNLRLEPALNVDTTPSSVMAFDMVNTGATSITHIVFQMSVVSKTLVLLGPYTIRTRFVLDPGYTVHYELQLSNLSTDCDCAPSVTVFSARTVSAQPD